MLSCLLILFSDCCAEVGKVTFIEDIPHIVYKWIAIAQHFKVCIFLTIIVTIKLHC